nr:unnamed protein product [Naegleria fowleri]
MSEPQANHLPLVIINNFKYDESSSGASIHWREPVFEYRFGLFPFSKEELLNHIRKEITNINNLHREQQQPGEKIYYSEENVRGIYMFGSRVSKTNVNNSDFDMIIIVDDLRSEMVTEGGYSSNMQCMLHSSMECEVKHKISGNNVMEKFEIEVHMMNTYFFVEYVYSELPIFMLSAQQPNDDYVLYECSRMKIWRQHWNQWFLRITRAKNSFLHELNYCFNKSFRFWNGLKKGIFTTDHGRRSALKKVKKNLAHGIRYCKFAYQIVFGGCIYDYKETNKFYDNIVFNTEHYTTWEEYKNHAENHYNKWNREFKDDLKDIVKDALDRMKNLSLKTGSLTIIEFLNRYLSFFKLNGTFIDNNNVVIRHSYEKDYSFQYCHGPFSLMRLFAINVTPIEWHDNPNKAKLFKLNIDMKYINLELSSVFYELSPYLECNGTIVGINIKNCDHEWNVHVEYYPVSVPRRYLEEYDNLSSRHENIDFTKDLCKFSIYVKPRGISCELFYFENQWHFTLDSEKEDWIYWVAQSRESNEKKQLLQMLKQQPYVEDAHITFYFILQKERNRLIFRGCRDLTTLIECKDWRKYGEKYGWHDQVEQLSVTDTTSVSDLVDIINDFSKYPPSEIEGLEIINYSEECQSFSILSSLHFNISNLRIGNANYMIKLLNQDVVKDPPSELTQSKHNEFRLLKVIVQSLYVEKFSEESIIQELNPLFLVPYTKMKTTYLQLCVLLDQFYRDHLLVKEDDIESFNRTALTFPLTQSKSVVGLFHTLKKFYKQTKTISASRYWRNLFIYNAEGKDFVSQSRFLLDLLSVFENLEYQRP